MTGQDQGDRRPVAGRIIGQMGIFFDRDNTLIACDGYLGDPTRVRLVPGAADAVARARALGLAVVVVSNQSGVARGLFTEAAVVAVNRRLEELLLAADPRAMIDRHEYCPYHPAAALLEYRRDSDLRKPRPGMILRAREEMRLAPGGWCVGDAPRDIAAGKAAGCRTILFKPPDLPRSPAADEPLDVVPDYTVTHLQQAMEIIERETGRPHPAHPGTAFSPTAPSPTAPDPRRDDRVERLLEQLLAETKRANQPTGDFSVTKLLAGVIQILNLGLLTLTYLGHDERLPNKTVLALLAAIVLQTMVTSLLVMGRQK